jgi:hypothetical protein
LPEVEGLPDGAESTADVSPEKVGLLKKAFYGLSAPFAQLVAEACAGGDEAAAFSRKPDWIVLDFAPRIHPPVSNNRHAMGGEERPACGVVRSGTWSGCATATSARFTLPRGGGGGGAGSGE